ncbi:MAG TPA: hypothetical protein VES19_05350 [Candidatus Limnocylindrales bacterium]|nr:hypothetical protein [Candidatus Limnocylindrales bacterium]
MTERSLPAVGVGVRARPHGGRNAGPVARPRTIAVDRPAVAKQEAILSTPARAGMLLGATAAIYAISLAGVSGLQAESEAAVAAARAPYLADLAAARAANDAVEARITRADAEIHALVATYGQVGENVTTFQARLDTLAALVADVQGSAAALPARIKLPSVSNVRVSRSGGGSKSAPATGGSSGASGG